MIQVSLSLPYSVSIDEVGGGNVTNDASTFWSKDATVAKMNGAPGV